MPSLPMVRDKNFKNGVLLSKESEVIIIKKFNGISRGFVKVI
jgi:hypothetical protein